MPAIEAFKISLPWPDALVPDYKPFELGKWSLKKHGVHGNYGYWLPSTLQAPGYMLRRKERGQYTTWMNLTLMELQSHQPHIDAAFGNVVVMGLGMGMYLYNILRKPAVKQVVVVEKDETVIRLFNRIVDWKSWPGSEKLFIVHGDALKWKPMPGHHVHMLYADIWPKVGDELAHIQIMEMQKNIKADTVGYWTQEFDYATFLQQNDIGITNANEETFRLFRESFGVPLIGLAEPRYPKFAVAAVSLQAAQSYLKKDPVIANKLTMIALGLVGAFDKDNRQSIELPASTAA